MFPGYGFPGYAIGAAFSADGKTFTRVPAAESPHGMDGPVLTARDAYQIGRDRGGSRGRARRRHVSLWFSSFSCDGTTARR